MRTESGPERFAPAPARAADPPRFHTLHWESDGVSGSATDVTLAMLDSLAHRGSGRGLTIAVLAASDRQCGILERRATGAGARVSDARSLFREASEEYADIARRFSPFEAACLLRWPVLRRLAGGAPFGQIWHVDSDMLFYAGLDELARDTAGKTFVLQGCPAFASIADPRWFDAYESGLRALRDTGEPGFRVTGETRARHRARDPVLGNASVYRIPPASDQDLIECLIGEGLLPQDPWATARGNRFYYMQNPLCLGAWHRMSAGTVDAEFEDAPDGIALGGRRVPFVHFQADASRFFLAHRRARSLGLARCLPHPLSDPTDLASGISRRYALAARLLVPRSRIDRARLMRESIRPDAKTGRRPLTGALNHLLKGAMGS